MKRVKKAKAALEQLVNTKKDMPEPKALQEFQTLVFEQLDRLEDMLLAGSRKKKALIAKFKDQN